MSQKILLKPYKRNQYALVSDEDYDHLSQTSWEVCRKEHGDYVMHVDWNGGKRIRTYMHRLVTNCPDGMEVDHINRNGLDNRRENLRICTPTQNRQNTTVRKNSKSGYKDIFWDDFIKRWKVSIRVGDGRIHKRFRTLKESVEFYNQSVVSVYGEFAVLNTYNSSDERPISLVDRRKNNGHKSGTTKASKYRGVDKNPSAHDGWDDKKWRAQISYNGKKIGLGRFTTEEEAALAYNKAASKYHGDKAKLNDI